ncbi:GDP-mannose 4,6-dehydratase, partial [Bacillus thuringiensis]|nr:GDP-mannose 4,6-dehydratase [Bacillus thuringiensis]
MASSTFIVPTTFTSYVSLGYSLDSKNKNDNFNITNLQNNIIDIRGDIRDFNKLNNVFTDYKPEIVFHLAAQPLVKYS